MNRSSLHLLLSVVVIAALAGCGGAGSTAGSPLPISGNGGSTGTTPTATPAGSSTAKPTTAPTTSPTSAPTATATPGSTQISTQPAPTAPPDAPGHTNVVPATPANGTCRAGQIYSIYVLAPTGDTEAFTVFEPAQLCGGQTYPLVMWGPGYSSSRMTTDSGATTTATAATSPGNIGDLVNANYGVVSIDERGFGEDTGTVRSMDPNFEGLMDLSVMDWAQSKLNWIKYGPTLEGDDPHEPVMGSIGGSYGGMYQLMLLNIDKRHRLHAIVPQITPNDLNYSLYPNGVVKDAWGTILYGAGETGGSGIMRGNEDPFLMQAFEAGLTQNAETQAGHDFFGYHSTSYFCNGTTIATDGDPGSQPLFAPTHPPKIHAMMWQGMRDSLFTFNNAYANYTCLKQGGGDVRLFTYQSGHNTLQAVPDPYVYEYYSATDDLDSKCGSLSVDDATKAFFDQYLKGMQGAASMLPMQPCLSMVAGDAVLVPSVTTGTAGTHFAIPSTVAVLGGNEDVPIPVTLGPVYTNPGVVAGIPHLKIDIAPIGTTGEPIIFFGIGQMHASQPGNYDLIDNQITPMRGAGMHDIDMTGIAARVKPGDQLALLIFGGEDQYDTGGNTNAANPTEIPVSVSGDLWLPTPANAVTAP